MAEPYRRSLAEGERVPAVPNCLCECCGAPVFARHPDPWEGRMDGYCEPCAWARCDTTDSTCPREGERPDCDARERPDSLALWLSNTTEEERQAHLNETGSRWPRGCDKPALPRTEDT